MENLRFIKTSLFIAFAVFISPHIVFAYKTNVHSQLTEQTIQAYNALSDIQLTEQNAESLKEGSVDEDDGRRPLNHFYDPISGKGLLGVSMPAPDWAVDTIYQANYGWNNLGKSEKLFSDATDYSWRRAVYEYSYGNKDRAMQTLGHILHLVQDASVPAHVRNDDHLSNWGWGDVNLYEEYTADIEPSTSVSGIKDFNSLEEIYKDLAKFTNKNFLSKDTVFKGYDLPKRDGLRLEKSLADEGNQYFGIGNNGKLVRIEKIKDWDLNKDYELYGIEDKQNKILANYYSILSNKAAEYGVATIDLFFREVEQEKHNFTLKYMNKSHNDVTSIVNTILNFDTTKSFLGSSLSAVDAYELNKDDWEGARRVATLFGIDFPPRPKGESAIAEPDRKLRALQKTKLPKPRQTTKQDLQNLPTIIRGTESGVNEILNPGDPNYPDYEQMGAVLLSLESILQELMLKFQKPDKCANKDLSIFKISTCVDPFDEGGLAFGAGGGGLVCPSGNMAPLPDGSLGCAPDIGDIPPPIFCFGGFCINEN